MTPPNTHRRYPVEVLAVHEEQVHLLVSGLVDVAQPDGKLREWHPRARLRPPPPAPSGDFWEQLCPGALVETLYHAGWWQARV